MTEQERERLSALLDGQLAEQDAAIEIRKLIKLKDSSEHWYRYHLIGDAIRQELGPVVDPLLVERLGKRLEQEPVVFAPSALPRKRGNWHKPAAGVAIAASVAIMAVTLAPQLINPPAPEQVAAQIPNQDIYVAEDGTRWALLKKPKVESRLNNYLVNHQEYAPVSYMKGIMPYASFVSYDGGQ